jgi:general secretion pathway protein F
MRYRVKAMKAGEGVVSLGFDARDAADARAQASERGYAVLSVQGGGGLAPSGSAGRAKFPLLLFTQELLALLQSGISLVEAIETLAEKESRPDTRATLKSLLGSLYEGKPLSTALQSVPGTFPDLYIATVRASERTGDLPEALMRFVAYQTQLDLVRKKIVSASIYPAILIVFGALVTLFLLGYVVPRFSHVYEDVGGDLPLISRLLIHWGRVVEANGLLIAALFVGGVICAGWWLTRASTRARIVRSLRTIPALGERLRVYQLTRFYRTLGMLLSGGIPVVPALGMVAGLLDTELRVRLDGARRAIREGKPMSVAMEANGLTTPVALRMLNAPGAWARCSSASPCSTTKRWRAGWTGSPRPSSRC